MDGTRKNDLFSMKCKQMGGRNPNFEIAKIQNAKTETIILKRNTYFLVRFSISFFISWGFSNCAFFHKKKYSSICTIFYKYFFSLFCYYLVPKKSKDYENHIWSPKEFNWSPERFGRDWYRNYFEFKLATQILLRLSSGNHKMLVILNTKNVKHEICCLINISR